MEKRLKVEILPNGKIVAETLGIKGKDCLSYIELLENLLDAEIIDSDYTKDYYENEVKSYEQLKQNVRKE